MTCRSQRLLILAKFLEPYGPYLGWLTITMGLDILLRSISPETEIKSKVFLVSIYIY